MSIPNVGPDGRTDVWKEERERLARESSAAAERARVTLTRYATSIGCTTADAQLFADVFEHIGRGYELADACRAVGATMADADRWHTMADDYAAAAADRQVDTDPTVYRDHDTALDRVDGEPFDPTWSRPRRITGQGVTVRGARVGTVVGGRGTTAAERRAARLAGAPIVERLAYRDALVMADAMLRSVGAFDTLQLIGTDLFNWHQLVTHRPATITTTDGTFYAARPEGAGRSIVGTARPTRRLPMRRATITRHALKVPTTTATDDAPTETWRVDGEPIDVHTNGWWPVGSWRVLKVYAVTFDGGVLHPRAGWVRRPRVSTWTPATGRSAKYAADLHYRNVTDGRADATVPSAVPAHKVATVRRVRPVDVATVADAITSATTAVADVHGTDRPVTVAYRTADGTTVTVRHEPTRRWYRVTVAHRHAAGATDRATSTVRSVAAVTAAAGRMARKVRPAT